MGKLLLICLQLAARGRAYPRVDERTRAWTSVPARGRLPAWTVPARGRAYPRVDERTRAWTSVPARGRAYPRVDERTRAWTSVPARGRAYPRVDERTRGRRIRHRLPAPAACEPRMTVWIGL
ncbi:hypothetical protein EVAR_6863_1 [Eumeta japonica]|uniref:Secreted protein n=1 Tax=Eumeta variegata TaxID=151549 RepID=A0A4C1U6E9_EUMVA|nr:hypothetical protein EVAR_6863_1 [Eumeta japonica]